MFENCERALPELCAWTQTLSVNEAVEAERHVRRGELDLLYVALERLLTERCLDLLASTRLAALPYHAGMDTDLRQRHQNRFLREERVVPRHELARDHTIQPASLTDLGGSQGWARRRLIPMGWT